MALIENTGVRVAKMCWGQQIIEVFPGTTTEVDDPKAAAWIIERYPDELRLVTNEIRPTAQAEPPATAPRRRRGRPARKATLDPAT